MSTSDTIEIRNSTKIALKDFAEKATFFSFNGISDDKEHVILGLGDWQNMAEPMVRLHSECLTGDVFASQKCDCGPQLQESMERIYQHGGFLVYLRQEGRGIGLYNKLDAYRLQSEGFDTYQSNEMLGFADDLREYDDAAGMLKALGVSKLKLLSNNPDKKSQLQQQGIEVTEQLSTGIFCTVHNRGYLQTKASKSGHNIDFTGELMPHGGVEAPLLKVI
ncbi:MAG: GTP cyclohydrolase II [Phenylobacterium sp.]|jgi:GTP cyclohydrolase II